MTIKKIYKKFFIPPNLQEHMLRVARVVEFIKDHWVERERVNWDVVLKAALLHDLGNLVKFNFGVIPMENIDFWKQKQKEIKLKYGTDDHEVTEKMLAEIDASPEISRVISGKSFGKAVKTSQSADWAVKILLYADNRVLPDGIGTLEERLGDIRERYPKYTSRPDYFDLEKAMRNIEKQIQENINASMAEISDDSSLDLTTVII